MRDIARAGPFGVVGQTVIPKRLRAPLAIVRGVVDREGQAAGDSAHAGVLRSRSVPWESDARCREHPEVNFYPELGDSAGPAKEVCRECLVKRECLVFAMSNRDAYANGVWGGTVPAERRELLRSHESPGVREPLGRPRVSCPGCGMILSRGRVGLCGDCSGEVTLLAWVSRSPRRRH